MPRAMLGVYRHTVNTTQESVFHMPEWRGVRQRPTGGRFKLHVRYNGVVKESFSSRLAILVLPDSTGHEMRLGSLWETSPAVVVFLRHYG